MISDQHKPTRGSGVLEGFLSKLRAQKATELIKTQIKDGRILDVGCGAYPFFLENIDFKERYGIDPSIKSTNLKGISLIKKDIAKDKLNFTDKYFDVITMLAVFEHIDTDKLPYALSEIYRILKNGGVFIVTTPSPWSDILLHQMAKFNLISSEEIHEHKSHYNMNTIKRLIVNSGFKNEKIKSGYFELGFNMWFKVEK